MTFSPNEKASRRRMLIGLGTAGAAGALAPLLPLQDRAGADPDVARSPPSQGGGYTLSEHVKRYYRTAKI